MSTQYQSHSEMGRTQATASPRGTGSNLERNINPSKRSSKKNKKEKVWSVKFVSITLLLAIIMFFICFTVGIIIGPDFPL